MICLGDEERKTAVQTQTWVGWKANVNRSSAGWTLDAVRWGKQHCANAKLAVTFVSIILAHASGAGVWSGPKCGLAAALLTNMSSL